MKIIAEYTIRENELATVLSGIKMFLNEIKVNEPDTYYEAFRKNNTFTFVHIMKFKDNQAQKKHSEASYTKVFTDMLYPRCTKKPTFINLDEVE